MAVPRGRVDIVVCHVLDGNLRVGADSADMGLHFAGMGKVGPRQRLARRRAGSAHSPVQARRQNRQRRPKTSDAPPPKSMLMSVAMKLAAPVFAVAVAGEVGDG